MHPGLQALAQWREDFSDGEINTSPVWNGNTGMFTVSEQRLRLAAPPATGTAALVTYSTAIANTSWNFTVAMDFNPSSSNYARVYLASDVPDLSSTLNGYFVMIGGANDDISLYRQDGVIKTKIIDGPDGQLNSSTFITQIKVTCDNMLGWTLLADVGLTGVLTVLGSSGDPPATESNYFGLQCVYTATRSNGFSFDDIVVEALETEDTTPPVISKVSVPDSMQINISFSEELDVSTALDVSSYALGPDSPAPATVQPGPEGRSVSIRLTKPLTNGLPVTLSVQGIRDRAGNVMAPSAHIVMYFRASPYLPDDVVITEIYADPSPSHGLPEEEFVELFNRSANPIQLSGWQLSDGATKGSLPGHVLAPGAYVILTRQASQPLFEAEGTSLGLGNFPSLNNSSDMIRLTDANEVLIDSIVYDESWYHDAEKGNGGWTLEIVDPDNLCGEENNWTSSVAERGGTPGKVNSVDAENIDLTPPSILGVTTLGDDTIRVTFSEKMYHILPETTAFNLSPSLPVRSLEFRTLREIDLILDRPLLPSTAYELRIDGALDCSGNVLKTSKPFTFAMPELPVPGDVVINEILFNPTSTGVDFVELWNVSEKFIDLSTLSLAKPDGDTFQDRVLVVNSARLLAPGEFLVATASPGTVASEYVASEEARMTRCDLPSLSDDEGAIALLGPSAAVLEVFVYTDEMHSPFLEEVEGVSLERIDPAVSATQTSNWQSASRLSGYATPGKLNSSFRDWNYGGDAVHVSPESFSPRRGEFVQVWYSFSRADLIGNVDVFDAQGRLLKTLARGDILGSSGFLRWDGDSDRGVPLRSGSYMIVFEVYDSRGVVSTAKKRVVISAKL